MNPKLILLLFIAAVSAGLMLLDYQHGVEVPVTARQDYQLAPAFELPSLTEARIVALEEFRGRYVLLNVWASWCTPCVAEFPDMLALAEAHPDLALVTLSTDRTRDAAATFLQRFEDAAQPNSHHLWDADQHVSREQFHIIKYPESILIDPQGRMIRKFAGMLRQGELEEIGTVVDGGGA